MISSGKNLSKPNGRQAAAIALEKWEVVTCRVRINISMYVGTCFMSYLLFSCVPGLDVNQMRALQST